LNLGKWECYRCSYVSEAEDPPEECPNCHYAVTFWIGHVEDKPVTVKNFVRTNVLKMDVNKSAWEAAKLMKENDSGSVLITIDGIPQGMVTERDILYKIAAEDLPASKVLLKKIMTSPIITTPSDTPITEAIKLMAKHHIRRLVVTENGEPIGMISQRSVLGGSFRLAKHEGVEEEKERHSD
jgi:CBS domain-containing protein